MGSLSDALVWIVPVVIAITLHEAAHGWMAERFGDDTARKMGRVTFNPLKHIDKYGTIIFPALLMLMHSPILFGYAKPVPVNFNRLQPPRLGMMMVALAGPGMNVLLAIISGLLLHLDKFVTPEQAPLLFQMLYLSMLANCVLAVFNMIPILPLDGGRVVDSFLTGSAKRWYGKLERFGIILVLLLLLIPAWLGYNTMQNLLGGPIFWLNGHILALTGNGTPA